MVKIRVKTDGTGVRKGMGRRVGCGTFVIVTSKLQSQSSGMRVK